MYIVQMGAAVGILCLFAFLVYRFRRRARRGALRQINRHRKPFSKEAFLDLMEKEFGTERTLTATVYDTTLRFLAYHDFTLYPSDHLYAVYGFTRNQVKDLMTDVCLALDVDYPGLDDIKAYRNTYGKIRTLEGLVVFLDWWRKGEIDDESFK